MLGAEGIAVGLSTSILPHNFIELLEAQIALIQEKKRSPVDIDVLPDFSTGGIMDASEYDRGRGKVMLRAKLNIVDDKTIVIEEICYSTTTESVMTGLAGSVTSQANITWPPTPPACVPV